MPHPLIHLVHQTLHGFGAEAVQAGHQRQIGVWVEVFVVDDGNHQALPIVIDADGLAGLTRLAEPGQNLQAQPVVGQIAGEAIGEADEDIVDPIVGQQGGCFEQLVG